MLPIQQPCNELEYTVYLINGQPHLWVAMAVAGHFREHGLHAGRFHDSERRHSRRRDSAAFQRSGEARGRVNQFIIYMSWSFVSPKDERQALRAPWLLNYTFCRVFPALPFQWYQPEARPLFVGDIARFGSGLSQPIRGMP